MVAFCTLMTVAIHAELAVLCAFVGVQQGDLVRAGVQCKGGSALLQILGCQLGRSLLRSVRRIYWHRRRCRRSRKARASDGSMYATRIHCQIPAHVHKEVMLDDSQIPMAAPEQLSPWSRANGRGGGTPATSPAKPSSGGKNRKGLFGSSSKGGKRAQQRRAASPPPQDNLAPASGRGLTTGLGMRGSPSVSA